MPYIDLCRHGYLTVDSQDGFWDQDELQYSYITMLVPAVRLPFLIGELSNILDEIDVYLNHSRQLYKSPSGAVNWIPMTDTRALTLEKDDVTGEFHTYSRIRGCVMRPPISSPLSVMTTDFQLPVKSSQAD